MPKAAPWLFSIVSIKSILFWTSLNFKIAHIITKDGLAPSGRKHSCLWCLKRKLTKKRILCKCRKKIGLSPRNQSVICIQKKPKSERKMACRRSHFDWLPRTLQILMTRCQKRMLWRSLKRNCCRRFNTLCGFSLCMPLGSASCAATLGIYLKMNRIYVRFRPLWATWRCYFFVVARKTQTASSGCPSWCPVSVWKKLSIAFVALPVRAGAWHCSRER